VVLGPVRLHHVVEAHGRALISERLAIRLEIGCSRRGIPLAEKSTTGKKRRVSGRSDVTDLLDKVVELLLGVGVFLGHLLVLGLPLVARLLESLDFAFVVAGLDVGLAEPGGVLSAGARVSGGKRRGRGALLVELADGPVRLLSLFLKDLDLALQALGLGASLSACTGLVLELLDLRFELLDLALEDRVLVRERGDLLLLLCRLALELLDLGLVLLGAGTALVGLDAEGLHALWGGQSCCLNNGSAPQKGSGGVAGRLTFLIWSMAAGGGCFIQRRCVVRARVRWM
jgi:hypothetical protein